MVNHNLTLQPGDTLTVTCGGKASANNSANMKDEAAAPVLGNLSAIMQAEGGKRNRKGVNKTRKNKQEGGKRKLSGYMKFANKVRPQLMKENPGMKIPELGKKIGKMWGELSDTEKKSHA
jgi:flagellar basal body L-ring protein FlgH